MIIGLIGNKGDRMNKVFINKDTDMVEQIFEVKTIDELPDDYFSNCYSVIDEEGKINAYNLKYNKATKMSSPMITLAIVILLLMKKVK